jgi:polyhydroxybutyrate depolymerase
MKHPNIFTALILFAAALSSTHAHAATGSIDPVSGVLTVKGYLAHSYPQINGTAVMVAAGTTAYSATMVIDSVTRRYLVLRPNPAPASAPMLLLLHPNSTAPEHMANLSKVADFVATQGFWAVLPEGINDVWKDDPTTGNADDVTFISTLIDTLTTQGVDATRVYAAGYSNGGFMSERLACALSDKIAAFGIDAATLRTGLASNCTPVKQRPKQFFLGTADNIVPYAGVANLESAAATLSYWSAKQNCSGIVSTMLPDRVSDSTTVQLDDHTGCAGGTDLRLYTIYNGGHAWPDGLTQSVGTTTQDIDATGLVWLFSSQYRR